MMKATDIRYFPNAIVTHSRGLLEFLSFGRWGTSTDIDFQNRTIRVTECWPWKKTQNSYRFHHFRGVDYSYDQIGEGYKDGTHYDTGEFRVGLRFGSNYEVLPIAAFRGTTVTHEGLAAWFNKLLGGAEETGIQHEIASRTFANMLREKMGLPIAV